MSTNFPTSLDSLTNPASSDRLVDVSHSGQHANANDAIEALQVKVGTDSSTASACLDYKLRYHQHNTSQLSGGILPVTRGGIGASGFTDPFKFVYYDNGQICLVSSEYGYADFALAAHTHYSSSYYLSGLADTTITTPESGQVLQWSGSKWINGAASGLAADHGLLLGLADNDHPQYSLSGHTHGVLPISSGGTNASSFNSSSNFIIYNGSALISSNVSSGSFSLSGHNHDTTYSLTGHTHSEYASSTHYHNASQINAGILSVVRGGTGASGYANPFKFIYYDNGQQALIPSEYGYADFALAAHTHYSSSYYLSGLADTTITTPQTGEVLQWDGSKWINGAASGLATDHGSLLGLEDNDHPQYALSGHAHGVLPIASGGTNASSFATENNIVIYNGSALVTSNVSTGSFSLSGHDHNTTYSLTGHAHGVLPIASGGTNNSTMGAPEMAHEALVIWDGSKLNSSAFYTSSFSAASHSHAYIPIGIVPIASGGTNAGSFDSNNTYLVFDGTRLVSSPQSSGSFSLSGHDHSATYLELDGSNANTNIDIGTYNFSTSGAATFGNRNGKTFRHIFTASGVDAEDSVVLGSGHANALAMYGNGAAYFLGRDVTNNIEFIMGTSTAGAAFCGAMSDHDLHLRTANTTRVTITSTSAYFTGNINIGSGKKYKINGTDLAYSDVGAAPTSHAHGVIPIASGGTNAASFATTNNLVIYDGTRLVTSDIASGVFSTTAHSHALSGLSDTSVSEPTENQVLKWNGSAWANGAAPGGGLTWNTITEDTTATVNYGYFVSGAASIDVTIPSGTSIGDIIRVVGITANTYRVLATGAVGNIYFGSSYMTGGGRFTATHGKDCLEIVCTKAGAASNWQVISSIGDFTVVVI